MTPASIDEAKLLVIDDEPDNLRLALEMLRGCGIELIAARDGASGLHIATRLRPDLILLDIRMPGMDGFAVCAALKADPRTREIPVIFLTALDDIADKSRGFAAGGVDYITKPFDARELLLRVASHLRLARRLAELQAVVGTSRPGSGPEEPRASLPAALDRPIDTLLRARDLLLADLVAPPDLTTLARGCGTNRTTLGRLFHDYLGQSVYGYLREQRLQQARRLLAQGVLNVESVAAAVGYRDRHNFTRAYRDRFGVPPSDSRGVAQGADVGEDAQDKWIAER